MTLNLRKHQTIAKWLKETSATTGLPPQTIILAILLNELQKNTPKN